MKDDSAFLSDWQESHQYVFAVARWLKASGYNVRMNVPLLRSRQEERFSFSDDFDIEVTQGIEVKRRGIEFTGPHDYPFQSVFVDEKYKVDERRKRVRGYVILNKSLTHVALVPTESWRQWTVEKKYDKYQKRDCEWYCCPKSAAHWSSLKGAV